MRVRIAARQSDLARLQAQTVGDALGAHGCEIDYTFRASLGDINLSDPLWKMPGKGVFTEDFLVDLIEGRCDVVVHSWKDLPTEPREKTEIVATLPRADARDLFLFRRDRWQPGGPARGARIVRVLTSSPRRAHNLDPFLRAHLPFQVESVEFLNVRGNVPTRVRKLLSEDVDGLIVAKAALDRLLSSTSDEYAETRRELREALTQCRWMVLPLSVNPTAAAQGALAIEIRRDRADLKALLAQLQCSETFARVEKERAILAGYGGGCHQKIGVHVARKEYGEITYLRGLTDGGQVLDGVELAKPILPPVDPAELYPSEADSGEGFFDRESLPPERWRSQVQDARFIWVAREPAWPTEASSNANTVFWTAGVTTWRKLAARGIWVSGTADGLGEAEKPRIETLLGVPEGSLDWLKVTHDASVTDTKGSEMRSVATYRLAPRAMPPDLNGKTHFFWMSGTAFDRALELYPWIRDKSHACGPGLTARHIRRRLGDNAKIDIELNHKSWYKRLTGRN